MSLSSPAAADQSPDETPNAGKPEKKSREGNVGVGQPLHVLVVEQPTRRRDKGFVEGLQASGSRIATVFGNTPSKVEVGAKVKERVGEAESEDVEEPAQLPVLPPFF